MRTLKPYAAILLLAALLLLSGCYDARYYFNFKEEGDLVNEEGAWVTDTGVFGIGQDGLFLDESWITAPLKFAGDFKVKANFWLRADYIKKGSIRMAISNRPYQANPWIWARIYLIDLGTNAEMLMIDEGGTCHEIHYDYLFDFSSLDRSGWNEMTLEHVAGHISLRLNGRLIYEFDLVCCDSEYYALSLFFATEGTEDPSDPEFGIVLKDVKVEYTKGNALPVDYI